MGDLGLLVDSPPQTTVLLPESFDLLFALEQLALVVVFFADLDAHLVLDVAEFETLVLQLLLGGHKLLGFGIQFTLHLVKIAVQHGHAFLQVRDLLIFGQELALVALNVVKEDCLFVFATPACRHGHLQTLQEFILGVVEVLHKGPHSLHLGVQILRLLLLSRKVFLDLTKFVLEAHLFILDQGERLLEIDDLELCFVLHGLRLECGVLPVIDLTVESGNLLSRLRNVLLQSGIVALNSAEFLLQPCDLRGFEFQLGCLLF